jgi:hypothetical protein
VPLIIDAGLKPPNQPPPPPLPPLLPLPAPGSKLSPPAPVNGMNRVNAGCGRVVLY